MAFLLVALGFAMVHASNPATWQWLDDERPADVPPAAVAMADKDVQPPKSREDAAGPTDEDPDETAAAREEFQALADKTPLGPEEMPAYWRLVKWSEDQSFSQMRRRAARDVLYTQLWEQPDKHRGKLIALRLHVRRAAKWDTPGDSPGVKQVYEAWGATDESKSLPYVVVFSELPPGMPLGSNVWGEANFVGYFLKTMAYEAFDTKRAAPLLIGRLEWVGRRGPAARRADESKWFWWMLGGGGIVLITVICVWLCRPRRSGRADGPRPDFAHGAEMDDWLCRVKEAADKEGPEHGEKD